jgi:hypothetical protein
LIIRPLQRERPSEWAAKVEAKLMWSAAHESAQHLCHNVRRRGPEADAPIPNKLAMSGTRLIFGRWRRTGGIMKWLALAAITLAIAIGFNLIAVAIQASER